jgi:hypothetical protein
MFGSARVVTRQTFFTINGKSETPMLGRIRCILYLAMLPVSLCWGQSYWWRAYNLGDSQEMPMSWVQTQDGNAVTLVHQGRLGSERDMLIKVDPAGDTIWTVKLDSAISRNSGPHLLQLADGNLFIAAMPYKDSVTQQLALLKLTPEGKTVWLKYSDKIQPGETGQIGTILQTKDGNIQLALDMYSADRTEVYLQLFACTLQGEMFLDKTYGDNIEEYFPTAMLQTDDGNLLIAGNLIPHKSGNYDIFFLKVHLNGDTMWSRVYGNPYHDAVYSMVQTPQGSIIAAGETDTHGGDVADNNGWFIKLTNTGDTALTKTFNTGIHDIARALQLLSDGNILATGCDNFRKNVWIMKITPALDAIWTKVEPVADSTKWLSSEGLLHLQNGSYLIIAREYDYDGMHLFLRSFIDDQYAKKDSLLSFKIPVGADSLGHSYTPLMIPAGMQVSPGGTITWTPQTAASSRERVMFSVSDESGQNDTLSFNLFVNPAIAAARPSERTWSQDPITVRINRRSHAITFTIPAATMAIDILDMHGRQVQSLQPRSGVMQVVWDGTDRNGTTVAAGRYLARVKAGRTETVLPVMLVR